MKRVMDERKMHDGDNLHFHLVGACVVGVSAAVSQTLNHDETSRMQKEKGR